MHDKQSESGAARLAWEMFEKTGNISYYMLYKEIGMEDKTPRR